LYEENFFLQPTDMMYGAKSNPDAYLWKSRTSLEKFLLIGFGLALILLAISITITFLMVK